MSSHRYFSSQLEPYQLLTIMSWTLFIFLLLEERPPSIPPPGKYYWKCPRCGRLQEEVYLKDGPERPFCDANVKGKKHTRIRMIRA
jgi:hypothetical protein